MSVGRGESTLLSNHGAVLLCIGRHPDATMRELAACVGITERATQRIVAELCERGYISRRRAGRRNIYSLHPEARIEEPPLSGHRVGELLALLEQPVAHRRPPLRVSRHGSRRGRRPTLAAWLRAVSAPPPEPAAPLRPAPPVTQAPSPPAGGSSG